MTKAYIGLGSNLSDPNAQLQQALCALALNPHCFDLKVSRFYKTKPVGYVAQSDFLNAAASLETSYSPQQVLTELQALEQAQGRTRTGPANGPRTLDLDLLWQGDAIIQSETLTLPHPRLYERLFVLQPLADLDANLILPNGMTVHAAIAALACTEENVVALA